MDEYFLEYNTNTKSGTRDLTKVASTTGNITEIYDMSGGAWEYVMDMDYQERMLGIEITRALLMPITHGWFVGATVSMVLMQVCSTLAVSMAILATSLPSVFVQ